MTQHPDLFAALAAEFHPTEVKSRQQGSKALHYVTARTVMNRLDNVVGPENWWNDCVLGENSVQVTLTIRLPDGTTLSKTDAGGYAGMADAGDDDLSGYSNGLKRAAVLFGVGRYLYNDGVPSYERSAASRQPPAETPAPSPAPATNGHPKERHDWQGAQNAAPPPRRDHPPARVNGTAPKSGKALFGWCKDTEQRSQIGILKYLNGWSKLQEFPARMVEWSPEQVALGYAEACRKLRSVEGAASEAYEEALSS